MKSTGITRQIDYMGRMVLPKELRDVMDIQVGDPMEVFVDADKIVFRKYIRNCIFCGDGSDVWFHRDIAFCRKCAEDIYKKFDSSHRQ